MYRNAFITSSLVAALIAPTAAHAAVVISEIAWMGTIASANAEWIELQNTDTSPVSLAGWTLVSSSGSPAITLTGTIGASGFYLLERTSDTSVPAVVADQIYTGALANTGLTLNLKDSTGALIDSVVGGVDWKTIGGDNVTKQTPQRSGSSWTTAEPTPKVATVSGAGSSGGQGGQTASSTDPLTPQPSVGGSVVSGGSSANPIRRLYVDAGPGRILTAGASVPFTAHAYDSDGSLRRDADFSWSFGDGAGAEGDDVVHTFALPGSYTVSIHASAGPSEVVSLLSVKVIPATVEIVSSTKDEVTLRNTGSTLLDVSGWRLERGESVFSFPRYTTLLGGQEAHFPTEVTRLATSTAHTQLLFPDGREVYTLLEILPTATSSEQSSPEKTTLSEQPVTLEMLQPEPVTDGIQEVEKTTSRAESLTPNLHEIETLAPSKAANTAVLGASVGPFATPLATSPWTLSFMGLLVAVASILVIL